MSVTLSEATAATILSPATDAAAVGGAEQLFVGGAYEAEVVPWMQQAEEAATEMRAQRPAAGPPSRTVTQPKQPAPRPPPPATRAGRRPTAPQASTQAKKNCNLSAA